MGSKKTKLIYNLWTTSEWIRQSVRAIAVPIPESGHWSKAAWSLEDSLAVGDGTAGSTRPVAVVRGFPVSGIWAILRLIERQVREMQCGLPRS